MKAEIEAKVPSAETKRARKKLGFKTMLQGGQVECTVDERGRIGLSGDPKFQCELMNIMMSLNQIIDVPEPEPPCIKEVVKFVRKYLQLEMAVIKEDPGWASIRPLR